jgi:hypothetical protein
MMHDLRARGSARRLRRLLPLLFLPGTLGVALRPADAEEVVFLQDGRTIQADKTEVIGDRIRVWKPTETIDLPRSEVLSIHRLVPPSGVPNGPPPAEVYRDLTGQMNDQVRRQIQERPGTPRPR